MKSTCLDISAAPGDERSLRVETVEAQSQLELLVEEDEYLDALLLKEHKYIHIVNCYALLQHL